MAGFGNLSKNLFGLATAHRPAVPPRGERAVIRIIAIAELTDHAATEYLCRCAIVKQQSRVRTGSGSDRIIHSLSVIKGLFHPQAETTPCYHRRRH